MYNRLYSFIEYFNLLHINQSGFRTKHSTIDALFQLTETIRQYHNKNLISFFLDLKKAFDTINHDILISKLELYGIRGTCQSWFKSYLGNRMQRVELIGINSSWKRVKCGVPQGSILGPLLFIIYINDLLNVCKDEIILFADDTNIEAIGCSINDVASDLKNINDWLTENMLVLNREKTIQLNIKTDNLNPRFDLNNQYVKVDNTRKYLGVRLGSKLTFKTHISHVVKKLSKHCGIISKLRHYVPEVN